MDVDWEMLSGMGLRASEVLQTSLGLFRDLCRGPEFNQVSRTICLSARSSRKAVKHLTGKADSGRGVLTDSRGKTWSATVLKNYLLGE